MASFNFGEKKVNNFSTKPKMLSEGTEAAVCRGSMKKILFAKFTGKQIYLVFFFDKVPGLQAAGCNFIKKEIPIQVFSCEV